MTRATVRRTAMMFAALLIMGASACQKGESKGEGGGTGGSGGAGGEGGTGGAGGGDMACGSCSQAFTNGGVPCGGTSSADAYSALTACACDLCFGECSASLCATAPSDMTCGQCLTAKCAAQTAECAAD